MLRWRRWLPLALLPVGIVIGLRYFLASHFVNARITHQLEALYGGTVRINSAAIGTKQTALFGVALFEPGDNTKPWLTVKRLVADLPFKDLITGGTPSRIALEGVAVTLRFDKEGRLLTTLPARRSGATPSLGQLPEITVKDGTVHLFGTGTRQMRFDEVALAMRPGMPCHTLEGHFCHAASGKWTASGSINADQSLISLTISSDAEVAVTQPFLETLPFVPPGTWQEVQAAGAARVAATFAFDWEKLQRNYRVELQVQNAGVHVNAIDLAATDVTGTVTIADDTVTLHNLRGDAHGGALEVDGVLDFTHPGVGIDLARLVVTGADCRRLPTRWSLPPEIEGNVHASCKLGLVISDGKLQARGTGTGEVREARVAGLALAKPMGLTLHDLNGATNLSIDLQLPATAVSKVADAFHVRLPEETGGLVALNATVSLPISTITDTGTYRANGEALLADGHVAGLALEPLTATLHYTGGELKVDELQAKLRAGGSLTAKGTVCLKEPFDFRCVLQPTGVELNTLQELESSLRPPLAISGRLNASANLQGTLRPFTVAANGTGSCFDLQAKKWRILAAEFNWHCNADGFWVDALEAEAYGGYVRGTAEFPFRGNGEARGQLSVRSLDLARLVARENASLAGNVDGDMAFVLDGEDLAPVGKGHITVADLVWKDQPLAPEVQGDVILTRQELTVGNIIATVARGNLNAKLVFNLKQSERSWVQLDLGSAELVDLLHAWPELAEYAQGTVDLRLHGTLGPEWSGSADFVLQRGKLLGLEVTEWRAPVRWAFRPADGQGELEVRDSSAQIAQGRVTAQASAIWQGALRLNSQVQFVGVNLQQAFAGNRLGNGRVTGRLELTSERLQSIDDLQGNLTATMQQAQAMDYPVLRQVAPILGFSTSKTFQRGEIRARLARSVVYIERLALAEGPWQLYADGNVTLRGNVHLEMTANSGRIANLVSALGWRVPAAGTIGADLLARATTALSPQLVHVHVAGNVREPTIQVVPLPLLTEKALRFFAGM
jgi:hypothetical protein